MRRLGKWVGGTYPLGEHYVIALGSHWQNGKRSARTTKERTSGKRVRGYEKKKGGEKARRTGRKIDR
jgi:hypothetical protein